MSNKKTKIKAISNKEYLDYTLLHAVDATWHLSTNRWVYEDTYFFDLYPNSGDEIDVYSINENITHFPLSWNGDVLPTGTSSGSIQYELKCHCGIDKTYGLNSGVNHDTWCPKVIENNRHG